MAVLGMNTNYGALKGAFSVPVTQVPPNSAGYGVPYASVVQPTSQPFSAYGTQQNAFQVPQGQDDVQFSSFTTLAKKRLVQAAAVMGMALTPLVPQSPGTQMGTGGIPTSVFGPKTEVTPLGLKTVTMGTEDAPPVRAKATKKRLVHPHKAAVAPHPVTAMPEDEFIQSLPADSFGSPNQGLKSASSQDQLVQPLAIGSVVPKAVQSVFPSTSESLRVGPKVERCSIDYQPKDTSAVFSAENALKSRKQLKTAARLHRIASALGLNRLKARIENAIIYHPEGTHNYVAPDSLRGEPVQHKFITAPSGAKIESFYQLPSNPDGYMWVLTHGNALGMQSMEGMASQIPKGDGFVLYGLPGFNKSVDAKGRSRSSEKLCVEAFRTVVDDIELQGIPKERIPLISASLGTAVSILGLSQDTANYRHPALIGLSTFGKGESVFNYFLNKAGLDVEKYTVAGRLSQPFYAAEAVKKLKTPILVFGIPTNDTFLPPSMPGEGMNTVVTNAIATGNRNQDISIYYAPIDHRPEDIQNAFGPQLMDVRNRMVAAKR